MIFLFALAVFHKPLFFSFEDTIRVASNDAPSFCRTHRTRLVGLIYPKKRSAAPERGFLGYCGAILTDRGYYGLPEDRYPDAFNMPRAELDDTLREGCRFRVRIVGYGGRFQDGDKPRVPVSQHISHVLERLDCIE